MLEREIRLKSANENVGMKKREQTMGAVPAVQLTLIYVASARYPDGDRYSRRHAVLGGDYDCFHSATCAATLAEARF